MGEIGLHIFRADTIKRVRKLCPYHKHLCFGEMHEYYDGIYIFFECGTQIMGEYYIPPKKYKRLEVFYDSERGHWKIFNRQTSTFFGKAKTKAGIVRIAKCHLKSGGKINWN